MEVGKKGGSVRTRTGGEEERNCLVVRQTKKVPGLWLTVKDGVGREGGVEGRRRMVVVGQMPLNSSLGPVEGGREGWGEEQEVCLIHFQGPKGKSIIQPFADFVQQQGGREGRKEVGEGEQTRGGENIFVFP
ncbi:hypothetical protein VYU27_009415 [Nannochloropsis oceanica]